MYHYLGCGLPDVYLSNGYDLVETPYGKGVTIHDLEGLHDAIGTIIVTNPGGITNHEFKFLRIELGLSQSTLAGLLGCDEQTIARWEKGKTREINGAAERILKRVYQEKKAGNAKIAPLMQQLEKWDSTPKQIQKIVAKERGKNWRAPIQQACA
jgi:putative transcriptional regulator